MFTDLTRDQLNSYDVIVVAFSGGKDSLVCLLDLLDRGVDRSRIELWHHDVDGREGSSLMDWPVTRDYCRKVAAAFGVRIFFSWKVGGFEREMHRDGTATAPTAFETPDGLRYAGGKGKPGTRLMFPQVSADLSVRWCSSYLKIDVCTIAIRNQARFDHRRTLVVSGERAEESPARSKYSAFEADRADARDGRDRRHVDRWRSVHQWSEARGVGDDPAARRDASPGLPPGLGSRELRAVHLRQPRSVGQPARGEAGPVRTGLGSREALRQDDPAQALGRATGGRRQALRGDHRRALGAGERGDLRRAGGGRPDGLAAAGRRVRRLLRPDVIGGRLL
jgi:3'-phosphoadenosine 5'-phosphosulfate sulfotransferase (PAPS reductase)/FAD synthetase